MIAFCVYALCSLTSLACMALLLRGWLRTRVRLLLASGLCFAFLSANNIMFFIDRLSGPDLDLSLPTSLMALIGMLILIVGLIWDPRRQA